MVAAHQIIHVNFRPSQKLRGLEDVPGMECMLTRHWWPLIQAGGPHALPILDTLYGALAMAGALCLGDVYDEIYFLIHIAHELIDQEHK